MEIRDKVLITSMEDEGMETTPVNTQSSGVERNGSTSIMSCPVSHNILGSIVLLPVYLLDCDFVQKLCLSLCGIIRREVDWILKSDTQF